MTETLKGLTLCRDYRPGALAEVVALHMRYYAPVWGLDCSFETKIAAELSEFLARHDPARDLFLSAYDPQGAMQASITIDGLHGEDAGAHLRWFIIADALRGQGIGRPLLEHAIDFCRARGYGRVTLTTFAGLEAARHLYESIGFVLTKEIAEDRWQSGVTEQHFALGLTAPARTGVA